MDDLYYVVWISYQVCQGCFSKQFKNVNKELFSRVSTSY